MLIRHELYNFDYTYSYKLAYLLKLHRHLNNIFLCFLLKLIQGDCSFGLGDIGIQISH